MTPASKTLSWAAVIAAIPFLLVVLVCILFIIWVMTW